MNSKTVQGKGSGRVHRRTQYIYVLDRLMLDPILNHPCVSCTGKLLHNLTALLPEQSCSQYQILTSKNLPRIYLARDVPAGCAGHLGTLESSKYLRLQEVVVQTDGVLADAIPITIKPRWHRPSHKCQGSRAWSKANHGPATPHPNCRE